MGSRVEQGGQGEQDMGVDAWVALAQSHGMSREFYIVQKGHREFLKLLETVEQAKMEQVKARRSFLVELGKCIDASALLVKNALSPAVPSVVAPAVAPVVAPAVADKSAERAAERAKTLLQAAAAVADKAAEIAKTKPLAAPAPTAETKLTAESKASVPKASVPKAARVACAAITKGGKGHPCPHTCELDQTFCKKHTKNHTKRPRTVIGVIEDDNDVVPKKPKGTIDLSDDSDDVSSTDSEDEFKTPIHRKWVAEDQ